jgi:hypothetical protein
VRICCIVCEVSQAVRLSRSDAHRKSGVFSACVQL